MMQYLPIFSKKWMLPNCSKFQKKRNVQTYGYVFHDINGQNHGTKLKIPWYLLSGHPLEPDETLLELGWEKWWIRNVCWFIGNNGEILFTNTQKCSNHKYLLEQLKNYQGGKTDAKTVARSYDMEGHAQKMRWEIPWTGKQSGGTVDRLGWPSIQTGGTWTNWRIIKSMLPNCLEMLVFVTNLWTWHSLVSEQTCSTDHEMDRSKWQTLLALDLWDVLMEVWRSLNSTKTPTNPATAQLFAEWQIQTQTIRKLKCWSIVACGPRHHKTNAISSHGESQLYTFEENEAVIKMIIWGQKSNDETRAKNPQSCAWVVVWQDRFEPQDPNQICRHRKPTRRCCNQKIFSPGEWNHLVRSFNIVNFSMFSCKNILSNIRHSAMSKRAQERTSKEGSAVAKPRQWIWCQETSWVRWSSARLEPTSASMSVTSTRRSTAQEQGTNTTQQSPPQRVLIYFDILELETPVSKVHTVSKLGHEEIGSGNSWQIMTIAIASRKPVHLRQRNRCFHFFQVWWIEKEERSISTVVQSLQDKTNLHKILERKADWFGRPKREISSSKILRNWSRLGKNPDMALDEINQEFESLTISAATCESDMRNSCSLIVLKCLVFVTNLWALTSLVSIYGMWW